MGAAYGGDASGGQSCLAENGVCGHDPSAGPEVRKLLYQLRRWAYRCNQTAGSSHGVDLMAVSSGLLAVCYKTRCGGTVRSRPFPSIITCCWSGGEDKGIGTAAHHSLCCTGGTLTSGNLRFQHGTGDAAEGGYHRNPPRAYCASSVSIIACIRFTRF
jgi:hypothetical protein